MTCLLGFVLIQEKIIPNDRIEEGCSCYPCSPEWLDSICGLAGEVDDGAKNYLIQPSLFTRNEHNVLFS